MLINYMYMRGGDLSVGETLRAVEVVEVDDRSSRIITVKSRRAQITISLNRFILVIPSRAAQRLVTSRRAHVSKRTWIFRWHGLVLTTRTVVAISTVAIWSAVASSVAKHSSSAAVTVRLAFTCQHVQVCSRWARSSRLTSVDAVMPSWTVITCL